jgi:hypothetical protein
MRPGSRLRPLQIRILCRLPPVMYVLLAPFRWGFFWAQACCACDSGVIFSGETLTYFYVCSRHRQKKCLALAALATA